MIIPFRDLDHLIYLADQIESGDYFDKNVRQFTEEVDRLKDRIYHHCNDPEILDLVDSIPTIELNPYKRSFLEQLLPKGGRNMVGRYKTKQIIRDQVQDSIVRIKKIRRWLGEE